LISDYIQKNWIYKFESETMGYLELF
jgi:hypothetical protein